MKKAPKYRELSPTLYTYAAIFRFALGAALAK